MAAFPRRTLMERKNPTLLLVLDGWGHAAPGDTNAITHAPAHHFLEWWETCPKTLLSASGREVGLPLGLMGNSEVGHTNLGAGRVVYQTITRIDQAIANGSFQRNAALRGAVEHAKELGTRLHLFGLIGNGGVHASSEHYRALLELAVSMGLSGERIIFHALLDGRDTPPTSAEGFLAELEGMLAPIGARVGTVCGRYYAMDRDQRWDRVKLAFDCIVHGRGAQAESAQAAIEQSYAAGDNDEFVKPTCLPGLQTPQRGDEMLMFNFRNDRVRQIGAAFALGQFDDFERGADFQPVRLTTLTHYDSSLDAAVAFTAVRPETTLCSVISDAGIRQLHCAETEKYAHVTFFFNGGREAPYPGEDRKLVPSPRVATYDLQPEMSAREVADAVIDALQSGDYGFIVVNFANGDMVGHTAVVDAVIAAVECLDREVGRVLETAIAAEFAVVLTADHGNCDEMVDAQTGEPHTQHSNHPVPCLVIDAQVQALRDGDNLSAIAPTVLQLMGLEQPDEMTGRSVIRDSFSETP